MNGTKERHTEDGAKVRPPKRPTIIRILRALKRGQNERRRRAEKRRTEHQTNEWVMAQWSRRVGLFIGALVVISIVTAVIYWRQLNVMQGQLEEMQIEQRPWVPQIIFPSSIGWNGLSKDTFLIGIKYTLKNTGKLPAFSVDIGVGYYLTPGYSKTVKSPLTFQGQVCDPLRTLSPEISKRTGDTIFPEQEPITRTSWQQFNAGELYKNADEISSHRILGVIVVGCVVYKFSYNETRTHQTRFIYRVHGKVDNPYGIVNALPLDSISHVDGDWLIFAPETEYLGGGFDAD